MRISRWLTAFHLVLTLAVGSPGSLGAQEPDAPPADAPEDDGSSLIPFPVIFYQPETKIMDPPF